MTEEIRYRKKRSYLWLYVSVGLVFLLVIGVGSYAHGFYDNVKGTINGQMYEPLPAIDQQLSKEKVRNKEVVNFLLLGVEQAAGKRGESDSMTVLSLNPETESVTLISIPREVRATMVGKDLEDKINHAYAYGGANMVLESVEQLLDIELDFYVQMNMAGAADLIDSLGGITVNNELDFEVDEVQFAPGELHLSGAQAMRYVKVSYDDPTGDLGRAARQQQVIDAIVNEGSTEITLHKVEILLDFLGENLRTNLDLDVIQDLAMNYTDVTKSVTSYMLQGSGEHIDEVFYLLVPDEEIEKVQKMMEGEEEEL